MAVKLLRDSLVAAVVLGVVSSARAEVLGARWLYPEVGPAAAVELAVTPSPEAADASSEWTADDVLGVPLMREPLWSGTDGASESASTPGLRELRSPPSSAMLFFTAMLSLGGWHVLRTAPHLHLSHVPDWYHTGGPAQIGHATPFDFNLASPPLCFGAEPAQRLRTFERVVDLQGCGDAQSFLLVDSPRGPPAPAA